jgi:hypothetical protein
VNKNKILTLEDLTPSWAEEDELEVLEVLIVRDILCTYKQNVNLYIKHTYYLNIFT